MSKTFDGDFYMLLDKLKNKENFAFSRFSDGELFILQNKPLSITDTATTVDGQVKNAGFSKEDHKRFDPEKHKHVRDRLLKAFAHEQPNYFKGLCCKCCVGYDAWSWQSDLISGYGLSEKGFTWANLFVNSNYPKFIEEMVPEFQNRDVVLICNEKAYPSGLPYKIKKHYTVGYNAMEHNLDLIDKLDQYIEENKCENYVFQFACSTLAAFAIHKLYKKHPNNTYINVGTTLNNYIGMKIDRNYLKGYWSGVGSPDLSKVCLW